MALAKEIVSVDSTINLRHVDWGHFPDGNPNLYVHDIQEIRRASVNVLASFDDAIAYRDTMWLMRHLRRKHPRRELTLILPYFPTGTMERSDDEGVVATASSLADDISSFGKIRFVTFDIHALSIVNFFSPKVNVILKSMAKSLKKEMHRFEKPCLVYPDDGAAKRFRKMFSVIESDGTIVQEFPEVVCGKHRGEGDKRDVYIISGDPKGMDCFIFDDLTHSCNTALECVKALLARGARSVSVAVTHGVMENNNWKKFHGSGVAKVYFSNSVPSTVAAVKGDSLFHVISLAPSIARAIRS